MIDIKIQVIGAVEVETRLRRAGYTVRMAVYKAVSELGLRLPARVKEDKLSGQVLNVRTGRLRRSINLKMEDGEAGVYASVGTNVVYARIHEYGGTVHMKARQVTLNRQLNMKTGEFKKGGRFVKAGRANYATDHDVGEHDIVMPERSFLRSSLADMRSEILERLQKTVADAVKGA